MDETWTLPELVAQIAAHLGALPAPANGQIRAVPDDRTVRFYAALGLLDRPAAMRGRTALYGRRHLAQVVAIKRLQAAGRSLAEIQALWPTLDTGTLARMAGVPLADPTRAPARADFWKRAPALASEAAAADPRAGQGPSSPGAARGRPAAFAMGGVPSAASPPPVPASATGFAPGAASPPPVPASGTEGAPSAAPRPAIAELRVQLAPGVELAIAVGDHLVMSAAAVAALRAAAAPLLAELSRCQVPSPAPGDPP